uniref:Type I polyketide synthase n=1 Tax=Gambierdiscus polynesiensis TaxID=439318 RepID=A0A1S6K7X6_9DINO|nr:type I polyketide synthase [Gambierdiscus polynesiensis]
MRGEVCQKREVCRADSGDAAQGRGKECKGKYAWLDSRPQFGTDPALKDSDEWLSTVAQQLTQWRDIFDNDLDERTQSLVCLTLTEKDEPDYPMPEPNDKQMLEFLRTWRRTLVRAVHFLGPGTASITLDAKDHGRVQRQVRIHAVPNTIVLFQRGQYEYTCSCPEETLMVISNYLAPSETYELEDINGNLNWLTAEGPQPPPGDYGVHAVNLAMRLPAFQDTDLAYYASLVGACDSVIQVPFLRWDSFIEGAELFDNKYFEISQAEASGMDPVQRMLLETGAQSLAAIGLTKKMTNRKSVHAGFAVGNDKLDWQTCPKQTEFPQPVFGPSQANALSVIANRFSFVFNLKGPNFVCDTACSAALSSTHMVKMMMTERKFDPLDWFLTMGAHLCLSPAPFITTSQAHMTSPKGRSRTFNAGADGYCRGEGVCGFMVKYGNLRGSPESMAMLRATQIGQDGRSASLTAPNGPAQEELIRRSIKEGGMVPPESTVWECHGTGTSLGDPIEVGAVRKVMLAAAMGAMCKCILQCQNARCCPTLHLKTLNPHLDIGSTSSEWNHYFATQVMKFVNYVQSHSQVSSFGLGGTNGHGIFWGENLDGVKPQKTLFMRRYHEKPPPEVRPLGKNYDEWEADFPDYRLLPESQFDVERKRYTITFRPDDPADQPLSWEPKEDVLDPDIDDDESFFTICGDHNNWEDEKMMPGGVPGEWIYTASIPERNVLHFRLFKNGDSDKGIGPRVDNCSRRAELIIGPAKDPKHRWAVTGRAGMRVDIKFFSRRGLKSINWLPTK